VRQGNPVWSGYGSLRETYAALAETERVWVRVWSPSTAPFAHLTVSEHLGLRYSPVPRDGKPREATELVTRMNGLT
jgi:hypothetical protein